MSKPLLTEYEVIKFAEVSKHLGKCKFSNLIDVEWSEFEKRLGLDFYEQLKSNLNTVDKYDEHLIQQHYINGDKVSYQGNVYEVIDENNVLGELPTNSSVWSIVDLSSRKFISDCFESIWCNGLARYLALSVVLQEIPLLSVRVTENGIVKHQGESFFNAGIKDVKSVELAFSEKRNRAWRRLKYNLTNEESECYSEYNLFKENNTTMDCGCSVSIGCGCGNGSKGISRGWAVESSGSCGGVNHPYNTNGGLSVASIRLEIEERQEPKPFSTLEEFYASGYKDGYLVKLNEEGAVENTRVYNPDGTK